MDLSRPTPWLFGRETDLAVFGGSALASLLLLVLGALTGDLWDDTPAWCWVATVLLVDVAHVWLTLFRVYLDPDERRRRPWLHALVPVGSYLSLSALYRLGPSVFWRALAYVAVWHFVRQQYGWVMLYRARAAERTAWGRWIDSAAIHLAALYPLCWWHAHLPRRFAWFVPGDFVAVSPRVVPWVGGLYALSMALYVGRALRSARNPGKHLVLATTAVCWWAGIITFDADYAFTVTNVLLHGVPYAALVWSYAKDRRAKRPDAYRWVALGPAFVLVSVWALAFVEEALWDRSVWHDRGWLFGEGSALREDLLRWIVPLLATPQLTHYVLDGIVWRRRHNPEVAALTAPSVS